MLVLLREGQLLIPQVWRFGKGGSILVCRATALDSVGKIPVTGFAENKELQRFHLFLTQFSFLALFPLRDLAELRHCFLLPCTICKVKIYGSWSGAVSLASKNTEKLVFVAITQIIVMAFLYLAIILQFFWRWKFVCPSLPGWTQMGGIFLL